MDWIFYHTGHHHSSYLWQAPAQSPPALQACRFPLVSQSHNVSWQSQPPTVNPHSKSESLGVCHEHLCGPGVPWVSGCSKWMCSNRRAATRTWQGRTGLPCRTSPTMASPPIGVCIGTGRQAGEQPVCLFVAWALQVWHLGVVMEKEKEVWESNTVFHVMLWPCP